MHYRINQCSNKMSKYVLHLSKSPPSESCPTKSQILYPLGHCHQWQNVKPDCLMSYLWVTRIGSCRGHRWSWRSTHARRFLCWSRRCWWSSSSTGQSLPEMRRFLSPTWWRFVTVLTVQEDGVDVVVVLKGVPGNSRPDSSKTWCKVIGREVGDAVTSISRLGLDSQNRRFPETSASALWPKLYFEIIDILIKLQ